MKLEQTLLLELLCAVVAFQIVQGNLLKSDVVRIASWFNQTPGMTKALNFESRTVGIDFLRSRIESYSRCPVAKWDLLIASELDVFSIPNESLQFKILTGLTKFADYLSQKLEEADLPTSHLD